MAARCLEGTRGERDQILKNHKDMLFYDQYADGRRSNLIFYSTLVREWLATMKETYPDLEETPLNNQIVLKSEKGSISLYPHVKVLVRGQLMEMFERDFPEMRTRINSLQLPAGLEGLAINSNDRRPDEPEGEGDLPTTPPPTDEK